MKKFRLKTSGTEKVKGSRRQKIEECITTIDSFKDKFVSINEKLSKALQASTGLFKLFKFQYPNSLIIIAASAQQLRYVGDDLVLEAEELISDKTRCYLGIMNSMLKHSRYYLFTFFTKRGVVAQNWETN